MVNADQRTIIITADLRDATGAITVDLGSMAPHVAASVLRAALDDLERYDAIVTVVHEGEPFWAYSPEESLGDEG